MGIASGLDGVVDPRTEGGLKDGIKDNISGVEESHNGTEGRDVAGVSLAAGKASLNVGGK